MPRHPSAPQTHFPSRNIAHRSPHSSQLALSFAISTRFNASRLRWISYALRLAALSPLRSSAAYFCDEAVRFLLQWSGMGCNTGTCFTGIWNIYYY